MMQLKGKFINVNDVGLLVVDVDQDGGSYIMEDGTSIPDAELIKKGRSIYYYPTSVKPVVVKPVAVKPAKVKPAKVKPTAVKPTSDPLLFAVVKQLREITACPVALQAKLKEMADLLELSYQAGFEDSYEYCMDLIDPHIKPLPDGRCGISDDSLIPSVNESLEYLIAFWVANKDKPGADLCL